MGHLWKQTGAWSMLYEQEAVRRAVVRKSVLTNGEMNEVKLVRRGLEGKRGR